jgi:hypothetical protein
MLTLAGSFRLRNRLKEKISNVTDAIEAADFTKNAGGEEDTYPCDGKTLEMAIREAGELMDLLREFNRRIEKANLVNRDALISLETLKAKISLHEKIAKKCRRCGKYEFEFDENGERVKVAKENLVNQAAVISALANLRKEKDALEDEISSVNFRTAVDFDPEAILSRI